MILKNARLSGLASVALLLCASAARAQTPQPQITVHIDPARTQIRWSLGALLHTVHGTFQLKGGVITFDPATGAAEGEMLVALDTGQSGDKDRDQAMKKNVLQTDTYPQAIYHPEKVSGGIRPGASQQLTVDGTFTIHGKDHPLRLVVETHMTGPSQVSATTHFVVPYVAWGMKDPSTSILRVKKQVDVDVTAQGTVDGLH